MLMGERFACTYEVHGDQLMLDCSPKGERIDFTINDDGSLSGGALLGVLKKSASGPAESGPPATAEPCRRRQPGVARGKEDVGRGTGSASRSPRRRAGALDQGEGRLDHGPNHGEHGRARSLSQPVSGVRGGPRPLVRHRRVGSAERDRMGG